MSVILIWGNDREMDIMGNKKTERYFFVDMENVHRSGLKGINELTSKDVVRVYYSNPLETLTIDMHRQIVESKAYFEYIKVEIRIKNAADMMILMDLKKLSKKNAKSEYIIISNDTDFDDTIAELQSQKINVKKMTMIDGHEDTEKEEKVRSRVQKIFEDIDISENREENIEKTVQAVLNARTKSQVNYSLLKIYDSQSVKLIYNELKPLLKELPGK